jgi:hypothetical protein
LADTEWLILGPSRFAFVLMGLGCMTVPFSFSFSAHLVLDYPGREGPKEVVKFYLEYQR